MLRSVLLTVLSGLAVCAQVSDRSAPIGELAKSNPGAALRQLVAEEPQIFQGPLQTLHVENRLTGKMEIQTSIQVGDKSYPVYSEAGGAMGCTALATVRGYRVGDAILASSIENSGPRNLTSCSSVGDQKTVVLLIQTPTLLLPPSITVPFVQGFMSAGAPPTVDGYFREASSQKTWITPTVIVPVTMPDSQYGCANKPDPVTGATTSVILAAMAAADSAVDFTQFNRIIMIGRIPASGSCPTRVSAQSCELLSTPGDGVVLTSWNYIAAEILTSANAGVNLASKAIGFNLGMRYSYTRDYGTAALGPFGAAGSDLLLGDHSIMGSFTAYNLVYPLGHVTMQQKSDMGWLTPVTDYVTVQSDSVNTILPVSSPSAGVKGLRVRRGSGYNEWLWIEYRKFLGSYDSTLQNYAPLLESGVLVHHERPSDVSGNSRGSYLLHFNPLAAPNDFRNAMLKPGTTWDDPYSNLSLSVTAVASGMQVTATYRASGGCSYSVSPTTFNVASNPSFIAPTVTTGAYCQWGVTAPSAFITPRTPGSGTGTGPATIDYSGNGTGAPRSGTVTIEGQTITINQASGLQVTGHASLSGAPLAGVTVTLSGTGQTGVTNASGDYVITAVPPGSYTVSAALTGYTFSPASQAITVSPSNPVANFTATPFTVTLSFDRTRLNYAANSTVTTAAQKVVLRFSAVGTTSWTATTNQPWLQVSPSSGTGPTRLTVSLAPGSMPASGVSTANVTVSAPGATNPTLTLPVYLTRIVSSNPPAGSFDTPTNGATQVYGSIAVTGWALDDIGVSAVKLYRDPIGPEPVQSNGYVYIADMVFVNDTRPDVEGSGNNSTLPFQYRAGWGYLMLTTGIPNPGGAQGNGTIKLWAIATDMEGKQTNLGSKTITLDNAHSVRPFGAIDTPNQGESISGSAYVNFGWALTPQPNIIGTGMPSQVLVSLDGPFIAAITYGQFRSDIAAGFPGFRNTGSAGTGGAGGYSVLDTTKYANGQHTIGWYVVDSANHDDGMGSRFFTIDNGVVGSDAAAAPPVEMDQPETSSTRGARVRPQRGAVPQVMRAQEMERLVIPLPRGQWTGAHVVKGEARPLPVGSTLDNGTGAFYWQLGPGFLGAYELLFTSADGAVHGVTVDIEPKTFVTGRQ